MKYSEITLEYLYYFYEITGTAIIGHDGKFQFKING